MIPALVITALPELNPVEATSVPILPVVPLIPAAYSCPAIPAPPLTTNAPVVVLVLDVVLTASKAPNFNVS